MTPRVAALAAVLLVATSPASADPAPSEVKTLYAKASGMTGCSERWASADVVTKCREAIAAYRAAEAASDATPDVRSFLAVERLKKQSTLAAVLREDDDSATARKELDAALKELETLAPGDTNAYLRVQLLDLQRQAALLELEDGNAARADAAIAEYRRHSQGFLGAVEQMRENTKAMNQQRLNGVDAGNFELELGEHYAGMLEDGTDKDAIRGKAIEAFERTRQWAIARADNDWNGFAEKAPALLYADASLKLAKLAHEADDMNALARYVGETQSVACGDAEGDGYDKTELGERCVQAVLMEGWVTGKNQALIKQIAEQQAEQMRAVREALLKK
ncbi:hypothetical protein [Lysobacter solisilvae (ex Woo and Kim 2020)]|uniref:DUF1311 domain-containing protein n=1 Tax=Agrilutibacter terrestris TaxID=2865112 RepID=A0A7H0FWV2_9GAMM|nr:hypothetical protein [Lysobacter terrestris]QNP40518.1 hypothetical protein H8B22_13775 [Lysobacter terrestris]